MHIFGLAVPYAVVKHHNYTIAITRIVCVYPTPGATFGQEIARRGQKTEGRGWRGEKEKKGGGDERVGSSIGSRGHGLEKVVACWTCFAMVMSRLLKLHCLLLLSTWIRLLDTTWHNYELHMCLRFPGRKHRNYWPCCKLPSTKQQSLALRVTWTVFSNICSINMSNCLRGLQAMGFAEMPTMWLIHAVDSCGCALKSGSGDLIDKAKNRITEIQVTLDAEADEDRKKKEEERKKAPETSRKASCKSLNACWKCFKLLKYPESVRTESTPYISRVYNILGWPGAKQYLMLFEENCLPCTWVILILTLKWAYSCAPRLLKHAFSG